MGYQRNTTFINPFDIKKIKKDSCVFIAGKRRAGKSFLVRDILYHNRDIPFGTAIVLPFPSGFPSSNPVKHYQDIIPNESIIHRNVYDPVLINNLIKLQEKNKILQDPYAFLLMDDSIGFDLIPFEDQSLKEIFFNGRHYNLLFILTMQSIRSIPPEFRINIDFTFIFKHNNESDREKLYKQHASMFPSQEIFNNVLDICTQDHHCLVIDHTSTSNKIEDRVFIYKADSHDNFKMGEIN